VTTIFFDVDHHSAKTPLINYYLINRTIAARSKKRRKYISVSLMTVI
jgi:hypothetical protein